MTSTEKEITILSQIHLNPHNINQRDLARIVGLSLGMTNEILKRLTTKGLLTIKKVNNRNIHYIVTPGGIEEITRRSYHYFKRTIKNVVHYRESIEILIEDIGKQGYEGVLLKGVSDLDFIVEHACRKTGIRYINNDGETGNIFMLYSENYIPCKGETIKNCAFLQDIFLDK